MYFDENILRIIYQIPDDMDIDDIKTKYLELCLQSAVSALNVFEELENEEGLFAEDRLAFIGSLEENDTEIEVSLEILDKLMNNKDFNKLYESYLDIIHSSLVKKGLEKNPGALEEFREYIAKLKDYALVEYLQKFVVETEDEIE